LPHRLPAVRNDVMVTGDFKGVFKSPLLRGGLGGV